MNPDLIQGRLYELFRITFIAMNSEHCSARHCISGCDIPITNSLLFRVRNVTVSSNINHHEHRGLE